MTLPDLAGICRQSKKYNTTAARKKKELYESENVEVTHMHVEVTQACQAMSFQIAERLGEAMFRQHVACIAMQILKD